MDVKSICTLLNVLRDRNSGKELIQEDLKKSLPKELKNRIYGLELQGIVNVRKEGVRKLYTFPKEPIHISKVEALLKQPVKKARKLNEKECVAFLKGLGYKLYRKEYVEV